MKTFDIGVDLDGVGYNLQATLAPYARKNGFPLASEERWNRIDPVTKEHGGFASWDIPNYADFQSLCMRAVEKGALYASGAPFSGFLPMMRSLADDGHRLHIVTARTEDPESRVAQATRAWLGEWAVPYRSLSFAKDKCARRTDFFIEDSTFNYEALLETGMTVPYLVSRPWNASFAAANRVEDLSEFVTVVRRASSPGLRPAPSALREAYFLEPRRA